MRHQPISSMVAFAKRGLSQEGVREVASEFSLSIAKKIAAGQDLSDDHVRRLETDHGKHDCGDDVGCMLMGGPAGAQWVGGRVHLMDSSATSTSDPRSIEQMVQDGKLLSYEVFVKENLDEPVFLDAEADDVIWAPILRSGTLATRPGPNGEKIHEPLVFVPGNASDPRKEIGLQDLVDAFQEDAVEHVTIPTRHENDLLDNTGFIRGLKIVDSKKKPGEKVLVAAHDFTEPEIKGKVQRGTIPNRSCGILYDYTNTETGKTYSQVLEHVALTKSPWVRGMEPYGKLSDYDFSEREVLPMLLSDGPLRATEPAPPKKDAPSGKLVPLSTKHTPEAVERAANFADAVWDGSISLRNVEAQAVHVLQSMRKDTDSYGAPYYSVLDVTSDKLLVSCDYGHGDERDAWVVPYDVEEKEVTLANFADWKPVEQQWVLDDNADEDVRELQNALNPPPQADLSDEERTTLASMTMEKREKLPKTAFAFPNKAPGAGSYPIHDLAHAKNALARSSGKPEESAVKKAVYKRYPQLKPSSGESMSDPLKRASARRLGQTSEQPLTSIQGGRMSRINEEQLDALGLSDEAKELFRRQQTNLDQAQKDGVELRKARVKQAVDQRKAQGFDKLPGVLRAAEEVYNSDDGDVAVTLQLSDDQGGKTKTPTTATQIVDRILDAFIPEGKEELDFSEQGSLLTSPIASRPDLKPDPEEATGMTGDQLQEYFEKHAPGYATELSTANGGGKDKD